MYLSKRLVKGFVWILQCQQKGQQLPHIHLTSLCLLPTLCFILCKASPHPLPSGASFLDYVTANETCVRCNFVFNFGVQHSESEAIYNSVSFKHLGVRAFLITPGLMWYIPFQKAKLPTSIISGQGCSSPLWLQQSGFLVLGGKWVQQHGSVWLLLTKFTGLFLCVGFLL